MRDPSIHITKSRLIRILDDLLPTNFSEKQVNDLVKGIFRAGAEHSLTRRALFLKPSLFEKKGKKTLASGIDDADMFANLLLAVRRKKRHIGVKPIAKTSKDWLTLKQVVANANLFLEEVEGITKKEAYHQYIEIGMDKMGKFVLFKFLSLHEAICLCYDAIRELKMTDPTPATTKELHDYFMGKVLDRTGLVFKYENQPEKYVYFLRAKTEAKKLGVGWKVYLDAQFHGFEWADKIPEPVQLVGEKAKQRAIKYMYEKNITIKKKAEIDWSKIREANDTDTDTEQ